MERGMVFEGVKILKLPSADKIARAKATWPETNTEGLGALRGLGELGDGKFRNKKERE